MTALQDSPLDTRFPWFKVLLGLAILIAVVWFGRHAGDEIVALENWIAGHGTLGKLAFLLMLVVGSSLLVPGSVLGIAGGVLFGLSETLSFDMGFRLLLLMFAAVVLGGLGTAYGAMVGGLAIGLITEISTVWVQIELKFVWALFALVLVLLVRPQGILGWRERVG